MVGSQVRYDGRMRNISSEKEHDSIFIVTWLLSQSIRLLCICVFASSYHKMLCSSSVHGPHSCALLAEIFPQSCWQWGCSLGILAMLPVLNYDCCNTLPSPNTYTCWKPFSVLLTEDVLFSPTFSIIIRSGLCLHSPSVTHIFGV